MPMSLAWISKLVLAAGFFALPATGWAQSVNISYLTHWSPETVALLESAAKDFPSRIPMSPSPCARFLSAIS
jgi:multiple sugar transport system substrate-binding protein